MAISAGEQRQVWLVASGSQYVKYLVIWLHRRNNIENYNFLRKIEAGRSPSPISFVLSIRGNRPLLFGLSTGRVHLARFAMHCGLVRIELRGRV